MQFSKDGNSLFIGDRTGDLYRFDACDVTQEPALLVGHVSILTSFFFSTDELMLVTADRDEKIKIHHYPQTYDIEHFCMQHKEYISKLWLIPGTNSFVSAGGDEFLVIWDLKTGKAEKTLEFPPKSVRESINHELI
jgi:tRNA (guanine-N(7)-)-methyltransferase subunit TRM82